MAHILPTCTLELSMFMLKNSKIIQKKITSAHLIILINGASRHVWMTNRHQVYI